MTNVSPTPNPAGQLDPRLLIPFIKNSDGSTPNRLEIEQYAAGPDIPDAESEALFGWLKQTEAGNIVTAVCHNCWTIELCLPDESDSHLGFNACETCYRTVCVFCHRHAPGPSADLCQCRECAKSVPTVPEEYAEAKAVIASFVRYCRQNRSRLDC